MLLRLTSHTDCPAIIGGGSPYMPLIVLRISGTGGHLCATNNPLQDSWIASSMDIPSGI